MLNTEVRICTISSVIHTTSEEWDQSLDKFQQRKSKKENDQERTILQKIRRKPPEKNLPIPTTENSIEDVFYKGLYFLKNSS